MRGVAAATPLAGNAPEGVSRRDAAAWLWFGVGPSPSSYRGADFSHQPRALAGMVWLRARSLGTKEIDMSRVSKAFALFAALALAVGGA